MCFFANRDITSRTELTFDYNWVLEVKDKVELRRRGTKCKCRSSNSHEIIKKGMIKKK
jgi:SET domain-containing protein